MTTAARSIGSATIAFGLVSIPVKLYSTNETADAIDFHMYHCTDKGRLKQQYACTTCAAVVSREDTIKGCEHGAGVVMLTAAELDALDAVETKRIEIEAYVHADALDPLYVEASYYLGPDKGADRTYQLLAHALGPNLAIARYAAKGREHVVAVRSFRDGLLLHQLRYEAEVKPWEAVPPREDVTVDPKHVRVARDLIMRSMVAELDMERYADRVQERRRALIAAKVSSGEVIQPPAAPGEPPAPATTADAMLEQLKASLDVAPSSKPGRRSPPARARGAAKKRRAA